MDRLRKMSSKLFKKAPPSSPPPPVPQLSKHEKLKHARSMPLRATARATAEAEYPRPVYRGKHPLKTSDIVYTNLPGADNDIPVLDISRQPVEAERAKHRRRPVKRRPQLADSDSSDDDDHFKFDRILDSHTLNQFPAPPREIPSVHVTPAPSRENLRARRNDYPTDLLPPLTDHVVKGLAELRRQEEETQKYQQYQRDKENARHQAGRQYSLQRSTSNASFSRPTPAAYPHLSRQPSQSQFHSQSQRYRQQTHPPTVQPSYKRSIPSLAVATADDPRTRIVQGPVAHRPVMRQASQPALPSSYRTSIINGLDEAPPQPRLAPASSSVHRSISSRRHYGEERQRAPSHGSSRSQRRPAY